MPARSDSPADKALLRCCARTLLRTDLALGRLDHLRARILEKRVQPRSAELLTQYLVAQPDYWPGWDSREDLNDAESTWASGRAAPTQNSGASERDARWDTWDTSLTRHCLGPPLAAVTVMLPRADEWVPFNELLDALTSDPFPLPVVRVIQRAAAGHPEVEYVSAVLPRPWAELVCDWAPESSLVPLAGADDADFDQVVAREVTPAEFFFCLPEDFADKRPFQACRLLAHTLAGLAVPARRGLELPRTVLISSRARRGWSTNGGPGTLQTRSRGSRAGGGVATIAIDSEQLLQLADRFTSDPRYVNVGAMGRLIDLMGGFRVDPDGSGTIGDWEVYQARWPHFYPGYWRGIEKALGLLACHGAVGAAVVLGDGPSPVAQEVRVENGCVERIEVEINPAHHGGLMHFLEEQRSWMDAYEMSPIAPRLAEIPAAA